jgi:hypothetical protein
MGIKTEPPTRGISSATISSNQRTEAVAFSDAATDLGDPATSGWTSSTPLGDIGSIGPLDFSFSFSLGFLLMMESNFFIGDEDFLRSSDDGSNIACSTTTGKSYGSYSTTVPLKPSMRCARKASIEKFPSSAIRRLLCKDHWEVC